MRRIAAICSLTLAFAARATDPAIKFEKYKLPNGLTVILSEDHRLPQVAVDIWYHVGAANQTPGRSGFAHLFEHMMFSGSKHVQPSPWQVLESVGASGVNGTTDFDRTNYFEVVPSNQLAAALWIESDRMGYLIDAMSPKTVDAQRDVVKNERRQSYENAPYGMASIEIAQMLYPKGHPYSWPTIGYMEDLTAASYDDVVHFFETYYQPSNASLVVAGDIDTARAKASVEKW